MPFLLATQLLLMIFFNSLYLGSQLVLEVFPFLLPSPLSFIIGLFQFLTLTRQFFILGLQLIQPPLYSLDVQLELLLDSDVLPHFSLQSLY
jgi:hypothetical protein